jgi:hypothetical protein
MRDLEVIDSELRLIVAVRRSIREYGGEPSGLTGTAPPAISRSPFATAHLLPA